MSDHEVSDEVFETQRPRLVALAARVLGDPVEAEDVVQQAWLRWHAHADDVEEPAAWLTTVATRLCLDRLKARVPVPVEGPDDVGDSGTVDHSGDPAEEVALADTVGVALQVVLDRLSPRERVAFVLHDTFGFEFSMIAAVLDCEPAAARKLASRARAKVAPPVAPDPLADGEVVDAFLAAARGGDLARLVRLLAPDVVVAADEAALALGTPARIEGREAVSAFFDGAAKAAFPVWIDQLPGAAWIHRGETRMVFDFSILDGIVTAITFRADADVLAVTSRRPGSSPP